MTPFISWIHIHWNGTSFFFSFWGQHFDLLVHQCHHKSHPDPFSSANPVWHTETFGCTILYTLKLYKIIFGCAVVFGCTENFMVY